MRISDWSSDVCSSDLTLHSGFSRGSRQPRPGHRPLIVAADHGSPLRGRRHTSCSSKALSTARVRSRTPSLDRMLDTWFLIVPSATPSELAIRSEEHTSELQSLMRKSYAVFCLKKKN